MFYRPRRRSRATVGREEGVQGRRSRSQQSHREQRELGALPGVEQAIHGTHRRRVDGAPRERLRGPARLPRLSAVRAMVHDDQVSHHESGVLPAHRLVHRRIGESGLGIDAVHEHGSRRRLHARRAPIGQAMGLRDCGAQRRAVAADDGPTVHAAALAQRQGRRLKLRLGESPHQLRLPETARPAEVEL